MLSHVCAYRASGDLFPQVCSKPRVAGREAAPGGLSFETVASEPAEKTQATPKKKTQVTPKKKTQVTPLPTSLTSPPLLEPLLHDPGDVRVVGAAEQTSGGRPELSSPVTQAVVHGAQRSIRDEGRQKLHDASAAESDGGMIKNISLGREVAC